MRFFQSAVQRVGALVFLPPLVPAEIPQGGVANENEMLSAMHRYRKYNSDVERYLRFLEFSAATQRLSSVAHNRLHNDAVHTLRRVIERFNAQVRIYKASSRLLH
jgi:hypothetical protein